MEGSDGLPGPQSRGPPSAPWPPGTAHRIRSVSRTRATRPCHGADPVRPRVTWRVLRAVCATAHFISPSDLVPAIRPGCRPPGCRAHFSPFGGLFAHLSPFGGLFAHFSPFGGLLAHFSLFGGLLAHFSLSLSLSLAPIGPEERPNQGSAAGAVRRAAPAFRGPRARARSQITGAALRLHPPKRRPATIHPARGARTARQRPVGAGRAGLTPDPGEPPPPPPLSWARPGRSAAH